MAKRVQSLWVVPRERGRIYSSDVELTEADALKFAEPGAIAIEYVPRRRSASGSPQPACHSSPRNLPCSDRAMRPLTPVRTRS